MSIKKNLLYITKQYPNIKGDTSFIENEVNYLSKDFDSIIIFSQGNVNIECIETPANVTVLFNKAFPRFVRYLIYFVNLFNLLFWKEVISILINKKSIRCVKQAFLFIGQAKLKALQIKKIIKKYDINIMYTFWYTDPTLSCILSRKSNKKVNIPVCTRTHRFDLYELRNVNNYQPFKLYMTSKISRIYFISNQGLQYYQNTFIKKNNYEKKCKLFYLGTENPNSFFIHKYAKEIQLISISNVIPVKRVDLIIEILKGCSELNLNINWVHIGDGTEFNNVQLLAQSKLSKTNIKFSFLGSMSNAKVHEYLQNNKFDLLINTSESEGLPVSMMEVMSYGIPVIATDVGGVSEIVDKNSGFLVSKENCVNESINSLKIWNSLSAKDKSLLSKNAYDKWNLKFNAKKNYANFSKELISVIDLNC